MTMLTITGEYRILTIHLLNMQHTRVRKWIALGLGTLSAGSASALSLGAPSIGMAYGIDIDGLSTSSVQLAVSSDLIPLEAPVRKSALSLRLQARIAGVERKGDHSTVFAIGPELFFEVRDWISISLSSLPSYMIDRSISGFNLGGHFHFTSTLEVDFELPQKWFLSCQMQHISNAGTRHPNPGLDMLLFGVGKRL